MKREVSIHAPVWVRHVARQLVIDGDLVSIHAPIWVRHGVVVSLSLIHSVSIHAPVWVRHYNDYAEFD